MNSINKYSFKWFFKTQRFKLKRKVFKSRAASRWKSDFKKLCEAQRLRGAFSVHWLWATVLTADCFQLCRTWISVFHFAHYSETKSGVLSHMVTEQWREFLTPFIKSRPQWKLARGCWTPGGLGLSLMTDVLWLEENKCIFDICSWSQSSSSSVDLSRSYRGEEQCVEREAVCLSDLLMNMFSFTVCTRAAIVYFQEKGQFASHSLNLLNYTGNYATL